MSKTSFIHNLDRADPKVFRTVLERIYDHLTALAYQEAPAEETETLLFEISDAVSPTFEAASRPGLGGQVDRVFATILETIRASDGAVDLHLDVTLQVRRLREILSGGFAFETPAYSYSVVGPVEDTFPYEKLSASSRATSLRKQHHIAFQPFKYDGGLDRARALIFEAPLSPAEMMLAGEAKARDIQMVLISHAEILPGVPTFADADEAFMDLQARCMQISDGADIMPREALEKSWALDLPRPVDGDYEALALHADILRERCKNLARSMTHGTDRAAARYAEMYKMIKSDMVPEDVREAFFQITANGSRSGDNPSAAQRINSMRRQIEALEDKIEDLEQTKESAADLTPD